MLAKPGCLGIHNVRLRAHRKVNRFWETYKDAYSKIINKAAVAIERGGRADDVLVIISCGFDASEHENPELSSRNIHVPTEFYRRFTAEACAFADKYASGRLISVLEGGYWDNALISGTIAHVSALAQAGGAKIDSKWWARSALEDIVACTSTSGAPGREVGDPCQWLQRTQEIARSLLTPPATSIPAASLPDALSLASSVTVARLPLAQVPQMAQTEPSTSTTEAQRPSNPATTIPSSARESNGAALQPFTGKREQLDGSHAEGPARKAARVDAESRADTRPIPSERSTASQLNNPHNSVNRVRETGQEAHTAATVSVSDLEARIRQLEEQTQTAEKSRRAAEQEKNELAEICRTLKENNQILAQRVAELERSEQRIEAQRQAGQAQELPLEDSMRNDQRWTKLEDDMAMLKHILAVTLKQRSAELVELRMSQEEEKKTWSMEKLALENKLSTLQHESGAALEKATKSGEDAKLRWEAEKLALQNQLATQKRESSTAFEEHAAELDRVRRTSMQKELTWKSVRLTLEGELATLQRESRAALEHHVAELDQMAKISKHDKDALKAEKLALEAAVSALEQQQAAARGVEQVLRQELQKDLNMYRARVTDVEGVLRRLHVQVDLNLGQEASRSCDADKPSQ